MDEQTAAIAAIIEERQGIRPTEDGVCRALRVAESNAYQFNALLVHIAPPTSEGKR